MSENCYKRSTFIATETRSMPYLHAPVKWSNMIVRGDRTITPRQSPQRRNAKTTSNATKRVHVVCERTSVDI